MATILAVDDSPSMRRMVSVTLGAGGHTVQEAVDGEQALEMARQDQFDVVITDVNMPNLDGIQLIEKLRTLAQYRFVPMLILTTDASAERKNRGRQVGATGWLVKPFNPDTLLSVVAKVLS